jgi:uroporphyrinogen-III synthase
MKALVTRPAENAAPVADALRARGIEPLLAPLLEIEPEPDGAVRLRGALAGVQAVLFTSANGVRAFAQASDRFELPAYCVGDASAAMARIAGFRVVASAAGDVADLAALAASRLAPNNGALLHAAGRDTAGNLDALLAAKSYSVRHVVLYRAVAAQMLAPELAAALRRGEVGFALFFSPRTANTFVRLARQAGLAEQCKDIVTVALSGNVAAALSSMQWRTVATARRPNLPSLLAVLDEIVPA